MGERDGRERWENGAMVLRVPETAVFLDHVQVGFVIDPTAGLSVVVAGRRTPALLQIRHPLCSHVYHTCSQPQ